MSRRNMWLGIGGIVIVAAIIIGIVAHNNKSKDNTTASSTSSSSQPASTSNSSTPPSSTSTAIIATKTTSSGTQYLVATNGKPLYTYGGDTNGVSNCTGACLVSWPIYGPVSSSASLPANVTIITRSDGKVQYAYKGLPLYYFSSDTDSTPTGDGVGDFHLATP